MNVRNLIGLAAALLLMTGVAACDDRAPSTLPPAGLQGAVATVRANAETQPEEAPAEVMQAAPPVATGAVQAGADQPSSDRLVRYPSTYLESYRLQGRYAMTSILVDGTELRQRVDARGAWVRADNPFGYDAEFMLQIDTPDDADELLYVLLGDYAAVKSHGEWMMAERQANQLLGDPNGLFDLPAMADLAQGERVGKEEILGISTMHYRITDPAQLAMFAGATSTDDLVAVRLDGWVAPEGYIVRYLLDVETRNAAASDGDGNPTIAEQQHIEIDYELTAVDGDVSIRWPNDAPAAGVSVIPGFADDSFPLPEGATLTPGLASVEVRTPLGAIDAGRFYDEQLTALGWTVVGEYGVFTATKDGMNLTILVTEQTGPDGGSTIQLFTGRE